MRPYDGYNDEALADPTADCRELITDADFDGNGQEFWLRYIIIRESGGVAGVLELYDQDEGVAVAANQRTSVDVPASTTTSIDIPAPGMKFTTNITAGLNGGLGTVAAYNIHVGGYVTGGMAK